MRSEDAVEIVRATLALIFPGASAEGLTRAAETVIRWGAEEATRDLTEPLAIRMVFDLLEAAGERPDPRALRSVEEDWMSPARVESVAHYRTWSRTEGMSRQAFRPRPEEERGGPGGPDGPIPPFEFRG
ncbi:hypothetical protein ACFCX4_17725 [Kitasatospora sp. NPDC056327]|uniref:hypothetical protein n=1 Tax=Kitasatospora sp. NPDC056327 TaxID=3345785 RepID=UPI0035D8DB64